MAVSTYDHLIVIVQFPGPVQNQSLFTLLPLSSKGALDGGEKSDLEVQIRGISFFAH